MSENITILSGRINNKYLGEWINKALPTQIDENKKYFCSISSTIKNSQKEIKDENLDDIEEEINNDIEEEIYSEDIEENNNIKQDENELIFVATIFLIKENEEIEVIYKQNLDSDSVIYLLPFFEYIVNVNKVKQYEFLCKESEGKICGETIEFYEKPLVEGVITETNEGSYMFQLYRKCEYNEKEPFYISTFFIPNDNKPNNHCMKCGNINENGVGFCSGKKIGLEDFFNIIESEDDDSIIVSVLGISI